MRAELEHVESPAASAESAAYVGAVVFGLVLFLLGMGAGVTMTLFILWKGLL